MGVTMALPTINLRNTTVSDIVLEQLAITVPGSGNIDASDFNFTYEILNDPELQTHLLSGDIEVTYDLDVLTAAQSRAKILPQHDLDIQHNLSAVVDPGVSDDDVAGYSIGSVWVNTNTDSSFRCVDDSTGAAVWEAAGGGGGTGGTATLIQTDQTLTTGSLSASGGTVDLNLTDFIDEGLIFDLQVTRTAGTGGDDIDVEIYTEDTFTNRIYFAEAADASTLFRDSSGIFYEDLDTTRELHIRITNQGAAAATFDVRARAQGEGLLATNTLSFTTVKTTNYTGNSWEHIKYDPSGGTFTITFPPSPSIGDKIGTKNVTASAISITVNGNGNNLEGPLAPGTTAASVSVGGAGRSLIWQYDGTVWWVV